MENKIAFDENSEGLQRRIEKPVVKDIPTDDIEMVPYVEKGRPPIVTGHTAAWKKRRAKEKARRKAAKKNRKK